MTMEAVTTLMRHPERGPGGELSDSRLIAEVGQRLAVPRIDPASSFVLHAPLELVARAALLPQVAPEHRTRARRRIAALADEFEGSGAPIVRTGVAPADGSQSLEAGARRLVAAIDRGDLDEVDQAAQWLGHAASGVELQTLLTAAVIPRLAAAAHAPIFLFQLPRCAPRGEVTGELLRGLARELARDPGWRVHWIDERIADAEDGAGARPEEMFEAIASTPLSATTPDHTPFIFPTMAHVDQCGIAAGQLAEVVGGHNVRDRGRAALRAAAWSMLLEPDDHAPYGWSHCLTLPQAALGLAHASSTPSDALAVAATYVVGFRAALARVSLETRFPHDDPGVSLREALSSTPATAAAAVWHSPAGELPQVVAELATRASIRRDAHLAKYTLACFDAADDDRDHARLFLAAAASLSAWWAQFDHPNDPDHADTRDELAG